MIPSDSGVRAKWAFWSYVLAVLLLATVPSVLVMEKAREYWRFVTGWQPGTLRPSHVRRLPPSRTLDDASLPEIRFIEFSCAAPRAKTVRLAGSFNHWKAGTMPMSRRGGLWRIVVPLAPGIHAYAFEVDGALVRDPRADDRTLVDGREVSLIHVR